MPEPDQTDLQIILEILHYLRLRIERQSLHRGDDDSPIAELLKNLSAFINIESLSNSQTAHRQEVVMNDHYEIGQAGVAGPGAAAYGQQLHQTWNQQASHIDLNALAEELSKVRGTARAHASGAPEDDVALAELANAEVAARQGDERKALQHLKRAGEWALHIAADIGVPVAVKAIETAIGS